MRQQLKEIFQKINGKFYGHKALNLSANSSENSPIEDYSLDKLQRLSGGNINFTIEMLQIYLQNADNDISELKASCAYNNWERTSTLAHKLIPACNYLQLNKLVRPLKDIEIKAKKVQDPNSLIQLVQQACDAYTKVRPLIISDLHKLKKDKFLG